MDQIAFAMKPGGKAILIAPTTPIIHRHPVDCWRILPDGWIALAKWAGLDPIEIDMIDGPWRDCYCVLKK